MPTFSRMFGVAFGVMFVQVLAIMFHVYELFPSFDVPMHFMGGVAMAFVAYYGTLLFMKPHAVQSIPLVVDFLLVLGFVAIIGIGWEWFEFILDHVFVMLRPTIGLSQASIGDTMADLFFDLLGGAVAFSLLTLFKKR